MTTLRVPDVAEVAWLSHAAADIGISNAVFCDLFNNDLTITDASVLGDFTPATYVGYAQQQVDLGPSIVAGDDGRAYVLTGTILFPLAVTGTEIVYGVVYQDGGGNLLGAIKFNSPITVSASIRPDAYQQKFTLRQEPL